MQPPLDKGVLQSITFPAVEEGWGSATTQQLLPGGLLARWTGGMGPWTWAFARGGMGSFRHGSTDMNNAPLQAMACGKAWEAAG